jgi:hypothetical protein
MNIKLQTFLIFQQKIWSSNLTMINYDSQNQYIIYFDEAFPRKKK